MILVVVAALLGVGGLAAWLVLRPAGIPKQMARDYRALQHGEVILQMLTPDAETLQEFLIHRGLEFEAQVCDLTSAGFRLEGGRLHRLGHVATAAIAYRGPQGERLLCHVFEGLEDLPGGGTRREESGRVLETFREHGVNLVFLSEGSITRALVGELEVDRLVSLAVLECET